MKTIKTRIALAALLSIWISSAAWADSNSVTKAIERLSQSKQVAQRETAADILKNADSEEAAKALAQALIEDQAIEVRIAAASALWGHEYADQVMPALTLALEDDPEVAVRAAGALKSLGVAPEELAPAFRKGLQANGTGSQFNAARGLIGIDPPLDLLPYLLARLQEQAEKSNPDGVLAAEKALQKLCESPDTELQMALAASIDPDRAGNHVIIELVSSFEPPPSDWAKTAAGVAGSSFELNRVAIAPVLVYAFAGQNQVDTSVASALNQLFNDQSSAVLESVGAACRQAGSFIKPCADGLVQLLKNSDSEIREEAADSLSQMAQYADANQATESLANVLKDRALNDSDDDVRMYAFKGYANLPVSQAMKVDFLTEMALQEQQPYIISSVLTTIGHLPEGLSETQKQRLSVLKNYPDAEVSRVAQLVLQ